MKTEGEKIDERDMEEQGKNRKGKGWGTGTKMLFFGIVIFTFFIM
jgi:hypothetical protein